MNKDLEILGCKLVLTCFACPEQYDVFLNDEMIGYLRLRHGNFTATYPDVGGVLVYSAEPMGDGFFLEQERLLYLTKAVQGLLNQHNKNIYTLEVSPKMCIDYSYAELLYLKSQIDAFLKH